MKLEIHLGRGCERCSWSDIKSGQTKVKVLGGGRDVAFSCVNRRWIYFGFFSSKHIISMTWWECFLVILLEDCRVGGGGLCVWTFRLSARNTGC